jgi:type IV fimbrial biogenesis protein FimT
MLANQQGANKLLNHSLRGLRGFTLVELVVVLAIMAILLGVGVPLASSWIANAKMRTAAEFVQNDLRMAQSEAVRRSRIVAFVLTDSNPTVASPSASSAASANGWAGYALPLTGGDEGDNKLTADATPQVVTGLILKNQGAQSISVIAAGNAAICFNSQGRMVTKGGTTAISVGNAGGVACATPVDATTPTYLRVQGSASNTARPVWIQINIAGRIRMCDPNKKSTDAPDGCCPTLCCNLGGSGSNCIF